MIPLSQRSEGSDDPGENATGSESGQEALHLAASADAKDEGGPTVASLPSILIRTSRDIATVLQSLYRSHDFLKQAAVERLTGTRDRLSDLSSTTESATHRILDGLDRTLLLIEALGSSSTDAGREDATRLHGELREEVHGLMTSLQFQDIVAQQIAFAVHVLEDTERRINSVAEELENVFGRSESFNETVDADGPYDPSASALNVEERQGLADSIFGLANGSED